MNEFKTAQGQIENLCILQLKCGHVFHLHCAKVILEKKWAGPRITFGFSLCPICKVSNTATVPR